MAIRKQEKKATEEELSAHKDKNDGHRLELHDLEKVAQALSRAERAIVDLQHDDEPVPKSLAGVIGLMERISPDEGVRQAAAVLGRRLKSGN